MELKHRNIRVQAIGNRLKELRIEAGYTSYVDFSIKHKIEPKQYWRLEAGAANFTINTLLRILEFHDITLENFFKGIE
ncbi:MAG: helix-turn-helix transcriptional regulator [Cyclobacteriaceae bacterium]